MRSRIRAVEVAKRTFHRCNTIRRRVRERLDRLIAVWGLVILVDAMQPKVVGGEYCDVDLVEDLLRKPLDEGGELCHDDR